MATVTIKVDPLGGVKMEANGFMDNSCAQATKVFLDSLHGTSKEEKRGPEYSIPASSMASVRQL